ncbi:MAG: DSBA oxidoreductase [Candidatus Peregrinibacteria bacterium Greene0416_19]|nr:MAG: DSBA oxidoreductase [Candidatus Peregrinibacteria bacterium Greene0416_19]
MRMLTFLVAGILLAGCTPFRSLPQHQSNPTNRLPSGTGSSSSFGSFGSLGSFGSFGSSSSFHGTIEFGDAEAPPDITSHSSTGTTLDTIDEALTASGVLVIGTRSAPLTLLLFTHQACNYCGEFFQDQLPRLTRDFIGPGKMKLAIALLPLQKYPQSSLQARALLCAAEQKKGLAMHRLLFDVQTTDAAVLRTRAKELTLKEPAFTGCLASARTQALIDAQAAWAAKAGVTLVPTFFLRGEKRVGLDEYAEMRTWVEEKLQ